MRNNTIVTSFGSFTDKDIHSGSCQMETSLTGEELTIDTLVVTVNNSKLVPTRFRPKGSAGLLTVQNEVYSVRPYERVLIDNMGQYKYGDPVSYYHADQLKSTFRLASVDRKSKYAYQLSCISPIGLLDNSKHYGGLYIRVRLDTIIAEIINGAIQYTIDETLRGIFLTGWLPIDSKRNNLHQVLFSVGVSAKNEPNGVVHFTYLDGANKVEIGEDRIFISGNITYRTPATRVVVTEHTYLNTPNDETANLYSGSVTGVDLISPKGVQFVGQLFQFEEPIHDLKVTGGTILESGVNYAILSPSLNCTLTGFKFTHALNEISRSVDSIGSAENTITISECTMINATNSDNVAKRVLSYYASAKLLQADIVLKDERPGTGARLTDPFGDPVDGFIGGMKINFGTFLRAKAMFADGFVPINPGNAFTKYVILRGNGIWTVPSGVTRIRIALIGGGRGGAPGWRGAASIHGQTGSDSATGSTYKEKIAIQYYGVGGDGGHGGSGSYGGDIYEVILDVNEGQEYTFSSGIGGKSNSDGSHSTFGKYSSFNGAPYPFGYINQIDGSVYATQGKSGLPGGKGSGARSTNENIFDPYPGEVIYFNGIAYKPGEQGDRVDDEESFKNGGLYNDLARASGWGGCGGGPAIGANGNKGSKGFTNIIAPTSATATGGRGANGATPTIIPDKSNVLGGGGDGGHGGGGGGANGRAVSSHRKQNDSYNRDLSLTANNDGSGFGGVGGAGGDGGDGGIIVFF